MYEKDLCREFGIIFGKFIFELVVKVYFILKQLYIQKSDNHFKMK